MRLVVLLLALALLVVGCSQARDDPGGEPGPSTTAVEKRDTQPEPLPETGPPPIVLVSDAGRQVGVTGSFCVDDPVKGIGTCADGPVPVAKEMSVVHPGDRVVIRVEGARAIRDQGCHARDLSCIGEAQITAPGCPGTPLARVFLERGPATAWQVALEPGDYEVQVFVYFGGYDGRSGDVSAAFGLRVDPEAEREVVPAEPARSACR